MQTASIICPLCNDPVDKLLYRFHLDGERQVLEQIRQQNPRWTVADGTCSRCVDFYHTEVVMQQRLLPGISPYFPIRSADDFIILPTGLRLDADQRFTGKNITICFIDSGFCLHPDLSQHRNRIKTIIDITSPDTDLEYFTTSHDESWHGTMTTVVCAGDGYLSKGLYKGIASDADLVLLKVQDADGRISTAHIEKALEWVLQNHLRYGIRIVNMSLGAGEAISYKESRIAKLAEQLFNEGVIVVAAVGNDENAVIKPPANSPAVIAVGGLDDENILNIESFKLYHSAYGATTDALMKPELIAPAIWIAAPILPGTKEQRESATLHYLLEQHDDDLRNLLPSLARQTQLDDSIIFYPDIASIRQAIINRIQTCKYISQHYMHVDGTSFAAPIVSSIIAQLLEAEPGLTPAMIRQILFSSAKRLKQFPPERQGFGVVHAKRALLKVLKRELLMQPPDSPEINASQRTINFYVQHDCASQIALAGSFNQWAQDVLLMEPARNGLWKIEIPMLPAGRYHYKFFVDEKDWIEDFNNPYREPDGFSGFNSILIIENGQS
jgi:serine protease AprX